MKKTLTTLAVCIAMLSAHAQKSANDSTEQTSLKASDKNWSTELNINPFKGELSLNNSLNQIKFRKFISDNTALRLGLSASRIGSNEETGSPYGTNPNDFKDKKSSTTLGINFGFENHFRGTKRLSPYIGADLTLLNKWSKQTTTDEGVTTTRTGAWITYTTVPSFGNNSPYSYTSYTSSKTEEVAYFQYGLNLVSGFDFYMSRHFYFGYEFNFGFNKVVFKDIEVKVSGSTAPINNVDQKSSAFTFGPTLFNGIRLGYVL